jgi:hypothetical protein
MRIPCVTVSGAANNVIPYTLHYALAMETLPEGFDFNSKSKRYL